jgi:uncharacterized protein YbbC (DUF1343 family)
MFGAPWINGLELAAYLNGRKIPGVRFEPEKFTPDSGLFKGELCEGVRVVLTNRDTMESLLLGMEIASALGKLYPGKIEAAKMIVLIGNASTIKLLEAGEDPVAILATWDKDVEEFQKIREQYLLYQ